MCKAIIGHCQCLRCMEHPKPGRLRRLDYCDTRQSEMGGIWNLSMPENARAHMLPCENLTFVRERDPDSCHFKATMNEDAEGAIAQTQDMPDTESTTDRAQEKPTEEAEDRGIQFTPINAAAIASAALATLAQVESSGTPTSVDDEDGHMDVDTPHSSTGNNEDKTAGAANKVDKHNNPSSATTTKNTTIANSTSTTASNPTTDTSTNPPHLPATPTKIKVKGKGKQPATLATSTSTPVHGSANASGSSSTTTATTTNNDNNTTSNNNPDPDTTSTAAAFTTPQKKPTTTTTATSGARTPLPTSRPSTPRVRQAEAAAAAAELAARARGGAWTHEETVRLLLLRCREVGFEDMGLHLPGRDAASCMDRLAGLAVKHGYEDYI